MRLRLICILSLFYAGTICGQQHPFTRYGSAEGLPENHVTAVVTDHRGFLWAATATRGVARFDGREFRHFGGRDAAMFGGVFALATDGHRWLFAGGNYGVRAIVLDEHAADRPDTVINRLLRGVNGPVRALRMRRDRRLYVETLTDAWLFSPVDSSVVRTSRKEEPHGFLRERLDGMDPRGMVRDCVGQYWVATDSGLVLLTDVSRSVFGPQQGLPVRNITSVCIDHEAGIWCGSDDGLFHYVPQRFFSLSFGDSSAVTCMLESRDRVMYFGTRGQGVFRMFDGPRRRIGMRDGLPSDDITSLHELATGELLVTTTAGVVIWSENGVLPMPESLLLPDTRITQVRQAVDRSLWFATMGGLVRWDGKRSIVFGAHDGLPTQHISCLVEDAYGFMLVGTHNGVFRVRATGGGTVKQIPELRGKHVSALFIDRKDRLWVGTIGSGVIVGIRGTYIRLGEAQGLAGGNIAFIGEDNFGSLYFGNNRGVSVLPQDNLQYLMPADSVRTHWNGVPPAQLPFLRALAMHTLTREMGLATGELQDGALLRDRYGRMWFGGSNGAGCYNPSHPPAIGKWVPPVCRRKGSTADAALPLRVLVTELCINDTCGSVRTAIELGEGDRVLRARLLLPTYRNPGQLRFLYRLQGMEYTWHESTDGSILYTGIEPGSYTLEVQASIGEGIWSDRQTLLRIDVLPPIERRWWFWVLVVLAAAGAGMLLQRTITRWRETIRSASQ